MLALAHRLQRAIDAGEYKDRAEIARQLAFTQARVTQTFDLLLLAPDIQEQVIFLERIDGQEPLTNVRYARCCARDRGRSNAWPGRR